MNTIIKDIFKDFLLYLFLSAATISMLLVVSQYVNFDNTAGFLLFKKEYLDIKIWKTCFYIHVFSAVIAMFAGFTQFSSYLQTRHRKIHRILGRIYVYDILIINFPAAMIMAIYANGGITSKIAFILLDILWFWFTCKAVASAKAKDFKIHRAFMIRSYALTLSAITLRTWKIILTSSTHLDPAIIYMMDAWLGFVPNLLLAEWIIRKKHQHYL